MKRTKPLLICIFLWYGTVFFPFWLFKLVSVSFPYYVMYTYTVRHLPSPSSKASSESWKQGGTFDKGGVITNFLKLESSATRTKLLKSLKEIPRHVPICWLTLLAASQRLFKCWPALKSHFLSLRKKDYLSVWRVLCKTDAEVAAWQNTGSSD